MNLVIQRGRAEGFILTDTAPEWPQFRKELTKWLKDGSIKTRDTIVDGLENAPAALDMLFKGGNTGKLMVKVSS